MRCEANILNKNISGLHNYLNICMAILGNNSAAFKVFEFKFACRRLIIYKLILHPLWISMHGRQKKNRPSTVVLLGNRTAQVLVQCASSNGLT